MLSQGFHKHLRITVFSGAQLPKTSQNGLSSTQLDEKRKTTAKKLPSPHKEHCDRRLANSSASGGPLTI